LIQLPDDFYNGYTNGKQWSPSPALISPDKKFYRYPKSPAELTDQQRQSLQDGHYPMQPIHPAQLYSTINALLICLILNGLFSRRKFQGQITAICLILYGFTRFRFIEYVD